ncbi:hypothetical protein Q673_03785 [Marinobacter sp. EN3]|jgi:hypothetical protein|nr:hypothetical protein Q673_03785 [Marinobacter sp. EN3]
MKCCPFAGGESLSDCQRGIVSGGGQPEQAKGYVIGSRLPARAANLCRVLLAILTGRVVSG